MVDDLGGQGRGGKGLNVARGVVGVGWCWGRRRGKGLSLAERVVRVWGVKGGKAAGAKGVKGGEGGRMQAEQQVASDSVLPRGRVKSRAACCLHYTFDASAIYGCHPTNSSHIA